jgi:excisionase family DNA binding protein
MNSSTTINHQQKGQLWDARDVAHFLKVSRSWVYQKVEAGLLPHLRIGNLVRFDSAAIQAFAHGQHSAPAAVLQRPRRR